MGHLRCRGHCLQVEQPEAFQHDQKGRHHHRHREEGEEDAGACNEAELAEALEISEDEYIERYGRRKGADRDGLPGAGEGDLGGLKGAVAMPPLFGVAGVEMDAVVNAQAKEHETQRRGHQVECAEDEIRCAESPRQTHQQRQAD